MWQMQDFMALETDHGYRRGAFRQCEMAGTEYEKPTGLLLNFDDTIEDQSLFWGWPQFTEGVKYGRWTEFLYSGPLPSRCRCGRKHKALIGKSKAGGFLTGPSAAWPADMCRVIMRAAIRKWLKSLHCRTPSGGVCNSGSAVQLLGEKIPGDAPPPSTASSSCVYDPSLPPPEPEDVLEEAARKMASRGKPPVAPVDEESPDEFAAPAGAGWVGRGPPMTVGHGTQERMLEDGAGLLLPWPMGASQPAPSH